VKHALVRLSTTRLIEHHVVFNTSALHNLFFKWGASLSIQQLHIKLLAMLCMLGALHVASTILPKFDQVTIVTAANHCALSVPIVGYKMTSKAMASMWGYPWIGEHFCVF